LFCLAFFWPLKSEPEETVVLEGSVENGKHGARFRLVVVKSLDGRMSKSGD
jgi:hypothetical protein